MKKLIEKNNRTVFYIILALSFVCVFVYKFLTPYLSDDLFYVRQVSGASSLADVFKLNVGEYISNNCRFIDQLIMRLLIYTKNKIWSDIVNSAVFVLLGVLVYKNTDRRKEYDVSVIVLVFLLFWRFMVCFGQTVLWVAGSSSYLYGITWILSFVTLYRKCINSSQIKNPVLTYIALSLLGIAAGMSNENTSGGAFLLVLIFTVNRIRSNKKAGISLRNSIKPYMIISLISVLLGLSLLVCGPGSLSRKGVVDNGTYKGLVGILSHIYKITVSLKEHMLILFILILVSIVILIVQKRFRSFEDVINDTGMIFLAVGIIVCYVMAVIEPTSDRVYFGASVFFIIALLNFIQRIDLTDEIFKVVRYSFTGVLCLLFTFTYLENAVNLARIYREEAERTAILNDAVEQGYLEDIVVPNYRPLWDNPYTVAYESDMTDDACYWMNVFYADYYGISGIYAVPREEWEEKYADGEYLRNR